MLEFDLEQAFIFLGILTFLLLIHRVQIEELFYMALSSQDYLLLSTDEEK